VSHSPHSMLNRLSKYTIQKTKNLSKRNISSLILTSQTEQIKSNQSKIRAQTHRKYETLFVYVHEYNIPQVSSSLISSCVF
jgi:hypothetical protein